MLFRIARVALCAAAIATLAGPAAAQTTIDELVRETGLAALVQGFEGVSLRQEDAEGHEYVLHSPKATDLRRKVLEYSLQQDNPIRLLQQSEKNLEEIFRSLTQTP